jgi:taurine dioxygenase
VRGVDLTRPLNTDMIADIRKAWLEHQVLSFPDQKMTNSDLERFTQYFGPFGDDPFIAPIEGHPHIIAVKRTPDETAPIFAESWHTDWSFQKRHPAGTCLFGITIPPSGGDTLFANQYLALEQMPDESAQPH